MPPTTKALVLGGGGPVGRAWHSGLLAGFHAHGIDLAAASAIIGTSAGAIVGAQLALGLDLARRLPILDTHSTASSPYAPSAARTATLAQLMALCVRGTTSPTPEVEWRAAGALALAAQTPSEAEALARPSMAAFVGQAWPGNLRTTAVDAQTGAFRVWTAGDAVPLERGVAASAALPGVWPAVSMGAEGARYVDGGVRSMVNADLARGHARVVVVSCYPLDAGTAWGALAQKVLDEIDELRREGAVVAVVTPSEEMLALTSNGANMLDVSLVPLAYEAAKRHADSMAEEVRHVWDDGQA